MKQKSILLIVLVIVSAIFFGGIYVYSQNKKDSEISEELQSHLVKDYSIILGSNDAKITIVEFIDPACGTCVYFYPITKKILEKYNGKVKLVYRFLPLHKGTDVTLSLVKAANDQGKFNETFDLFMNNVKRWYINGDTNIFVAWGILQEAGVDIEKAKEYLSKNSDKIRAQFNENMQDANALALTGTPTFFINGKMLEKLSEDELDKIIEAEIKRVY